MRGQFVLCIFTNSLIGIESVCNNGQNSIILIKTIDSKSVEYANFIDKRVKSFINEYPDLDVENDFAIYNAYCHELLKEGEIYGFTFIEG